VLILSLFAAGLIALTVLIHACGLVLILRQLTGSSGTLPVRFWPASWLLIRVALMLIMIHLVEIFFWAVFYYWQGHMPDIESALYFSGATYTTIGYGDLVLPAPWRVLGPVEGLTGILMCGLSASAFLAVASKLLSTHFDQTKHRPTSNP
jgi:Ion channel